MNDDLVERLQGGIIEHDKRWSGDTHDDLGGSADYEATEALMAEAAAALSEAAATIARQQVMLDRALEDAGDKMVEIARLRGLLAATTEWMEETRASGDAGFWEWHPDDVYSRARAALEAKHG